MLESPRRQTNTPLAGVTLSFSRNLALLKNRKRATLRTLVGVYLTIVAFTKQGEWHVMPPLQERNRPYAAYLGPRTLSPFPEKQRCPATTPQSKINRCKAMYKILIADDHPLFREAIANVISDGFPGSEALETADLESALLLTQRHDDFDLILL